MKKLSLFFFILLLTSSSLSAFSTLPSKFFVTQRWLSLVLTFDIGTAELNLGSVQKKYFSLRTQYHFFDADGVLRAKAKKRIVRLGVVFDLTDEFDTPIGHVDEHLMTLTPSFDIVSVDERILASADLNYWGTKCVLKDPLSNEEIAVLSRAFISFKDSWTVTIANPQSLATKGIDPPLFITVMAFQTDSENQNANWNKLDLSSVPFKEEISAFLAACENDVALSPQEEDFETVAALVDAAVINRTDPLEYLQELVTLIDDTSLTREQRKALYFLLKKSLK